MRIRTFGKFIELENLKVHLLKNSTVVVDAQNFFYKLYQQSDLEYIFGCDSDKYANYLKEYLSMFKEANVTCYFIFKGGHQDLRKMLDAIAPDKINGRIFDINQDYDEIILPIFMKEVYKQVLDEMGFNYTICEFEAKKECIALAQKLKCPVISTDIEFCFSGLPYIMQSTLKFDAANKNIECGQFLLDEFLKKRRLNEDKLALFAALTDEKEFPNDHFLPVVRALKMPLGYYQRNKAILQWLARTTKESALDQIFRYQRLGEEDRSKFLEVLRKHRGLIRRQETPGIPAQYLENGNKIEVSEKDPFWFEKGVAAKNIALQLVNPACSGIVEGSWAIADYTQGDARLLSMDIIKYAYNLLTNFEKDQFILHINKQEFPVPVTNSVSKPYYSGISSPFENGWKNLKGELFKHFLNEALQGLDSEVVESLPDDLRMLMITLIYFADKKSVQTRNEVCSVLLSYVALSVLTDVDNNNNTYQIKAKDKLAVKDVLSKFFNVTKMEAKSIFNVKMLHPLVEFQHCLHSMNHLNVLCGELYKPTIYSNTYNATFVYKVLYTIEKEFDGNCMEFLQQKLNEGPTVLLFIRHLMKIFDDVMAGL